MNEGSRKHWGEKMINAGEITLAIGVVGTAISGILFIASEPNLSAEAVQRLSTNVSGFFQAAEGFLAVIAGGAGTMLMGDKLKK
jgi:hypothetical protein